MGRTPNLIAFAFLLAFGNAQTTTHPWPQEPTGFKNVTFGSSRKVAREIIHFRLGECPRFESSPCSMKIDGGGFIMTAFLQFDDKKFSEALGSFPSDHYLEVREIFVSRYGPPHNVQASEVQNLVGGQFKQETLRWNGQRASVTLMRYGSTVTDGVFFVGLNGADASEAAAREAARKKALQ
jgi:hypothetical protein